MENQIKEEIVCPICGKNTEFFASKKEFLLARCRACQTIFVTNPPPDTASFYTEGYFFGGNDCGGYMNYDVEKEAMKDTFIYALARIEEYRSKGKMLDVGAASGFFLSLARSRGWIVEGIDIAPSARTIAAKKNIEVKTGTLVPNVYCTEQFDAVTAFDVIEHTDDPMMLLSSIHTILTPGGVLCGSTPDAGSLYAKLMRKNWHLICPPEHLTLFSEKSLRIALADAGFEILWTGRIGKRFTLPYILQTVSRWLNLIFLNRIAAWLSGTPLSRFSIPLDLRDNVFFIARRI